MLIQNPSSTVEYITFPQFSNPKNSIDDVQIFIK